jgi:hypothetical protein
MNFFSTFYTCFIIPLFVLFSLHLLCLKDKFQIDALPFFSSSSSSYSNTTFANEKLKKILSDLLISKSYENRQMVSEAIVDESSDIVNQNTSSEKLNWKMIEEDLSIYLSCKQRVEFVA